VDEAGIPRALGRRAVEGDSTCSGDGRRERQRARRAGVGEKTASRLVVEHGSLEACSRRTRVAAEEARRAAVEHAELARLSKRLVTIDCAVPISTDWDDLARRAVDAAVLRLAYGELEFTERLAALAPRAPEGAAGSPAGPASDDRRYRAVETAKELDALVAALKATKGKGGFTLDTETTSVHPTQAELVGLSFSWRRTSHYVPVNRDPPDGFGGEATRAKAAGTLFDEEGPRSGDLAAVLDRLRPVLEDPTLEKTGQNAKYDMIVLACQEPRGVDVRGVAFDTMIASWCLRPDGRTHNLDAMSLEHLCVTKIRQRPDRRGKAQITIARGADREGGDLRLRGRRLHAPPASALRAEVDGGRARPGLPRDRDAAPPRARAHGAHGHPRRSRRAAAHEPRARGAGEEARGGDPRGGRGAVQPAQQREDRGAALRQVEAARDRRAQAARRTEKGTGYSTDERTLLELAPYHPLPSKLVDWRMLTKLKSTYVDPLPEAVNPRTGRIHTTFHQTGAATGRLLVVGPQPPEHSRARRGGPGDPRGVRAERGWKLLSADYSQIELRLLAHLADDPGLLAAFRAGEDIHRATAAKVMGVALDAVTPEMRGRAKAINFGIVYGMGR